jgi:hypothetical protein
MAKHVIVESYTFTPSTKTIVVTGKCIRKEQLLLITNTTTNTVIYNFSDPSLGATSHINTVDSITGQETTTMVLSYNTVAMLSTHNIAILVEETYTEIIPAEVMRDPVDKLRVSNPQALIDTDFEYGTQPTKWESVSMLNNRASAFYDYTQPLTNTAAVLSFQGANTNSYQITNVTASAKVVTVSITNANAALSGITVGTPIFLQGTLDTANADGWWVVESVAGSNPSYTITFTTSNAPAAALFDATKTYLFIGTFYTASPIPAGTGAIVLNGTIATVTTTNAHGLQVGNGIYVVGVTGQTGTLLSSWVVATTPSSNTFTFACTATGTITATLNASIYPRTLGYVQHRAFDGGVQFSNVSPYQGYQLIRQTRRYFRYQSGKGIQFSTGSMLKPALTVDNITNGGSGATITVTTKVAHGLLPGAVITVSGSTDTAYNGRYTVATAPTLVSFTYTSTSRLDATGATPTYAPAPGFPINVTPYSWYGSSNRVGMFDLQNGFYFEFDGQTLYAVKRSSTQQISGTITVTNGSNTIAGTSTKFSVQLKPGDWIVIRGQSYIVQTIASDTSMFIYPEYRGTTISTASVVVSKTINTRYAQSTWNIDKCDGTGTSGYNIDLTRMQMFYADYTWYGAGAIRFGFKNNRGEVIYCHRIPNNNINTEAYMRSGNLPARYETNTLPPWTYLTATLTSGVTASMTVADTTGFPSAGTVIVTASGNTGAAIEFVSYTSKTSTTLVGLTRNVAGGTASATTHTITGNTVPNPGGTAPIQIELYSPQVASTISHWGSSVIMDGRYDDDKSFLFNYGLSSPSVFTTAGTRYPVFSIRLAPSVDSGTTGLLGAREIINRMQLTLSSCGVYTTAAGVKVEIFLNGRVSTGTFAAVGGSSLAQFANHGTTATITGGESIFTFFVASGSTNSQDVSKVRDIGNSILGGGTSLTVPTTANNIYPDGPDIITICVTPLASNASVNARLNWTEAQA